jgi:hypothetical protein
MLNAHKNEGYYARYRSSNTGGASGDKRNVAGKLGRAGEGIGDQCEPSLRGGTSGGGCQRRKRWLEENRAAMDQYNEYVEKNGLPLAEYRMF